MATGIFKLRDQLYGLVQKGWSGPVPNYGAPFNGSKTLVTSSTQIIPTGSYTIEFFVYITGAGVTQYMVAQGVSGGGSNSVFVGVDTNWIFQSGADFVKGGTVIRNAWNYVAATYNGSTLNLYVNGSSIGSTAHTGSVPNAALSIGDLNAAWASSPFTGYMSNIRISNTVLTVTSVPTAPFTATANTVFLSLQNSTIVDNSTNAYSITNSGSIAMSAQAPFNNAVATPAVEYLVVAGGGGGGGDTGGDGTGGGGAGGLIQGISNVTTGSAITVTVGGGGAGGAGGHNPGVTGANSVFGSITGSGGGGGGSAASSSSEGLSGGSGGGGSNYAGSRLGGVGTYGQGNAGGAGTTGYVGGGGGGAGTIGLDGVATKIGGNGGAGIASSISGTVTAYAGGGGGGTDGGSGNQGIGGAGGGGNGQYSGGSAPTAGTANTGGGGGGSIAASGSTAGANGGSGICIISYPDTYNAPSALTGTYSASTSGSGSLYLNGSSAVTYPSNSAFNLGSNNFTIEMWVYKNTSGSQTFAAQVNSSLTATTWSFDIGTNSSNVILAEVYVAAIAYTVTTSTTMSLNTWYHIAFVRSSTTLTVYVNGVSTGTAAVVGSVNSGSTPMTLGRLGDYTSNYYTNGYVSNFRYITGTAVYTTNFTPLTAPLTPISGTQLLLTTVSPDGYLDSSTNSFAPTLVSTPTWNQLSPFATGLGYKNRVYTWTGSGTVTF